MDWKQLIIEILARGFTLAEIATECGFASAGALHDLKSGKQITCNYERGVLLLGMHKRVIRKPVLAA